MTNDIKKEIEKEPTKREKLEDFLINWTKEKHLDKSRKLNSGEIHSKRYGCNSRCDGYICGWISREKELSEMGCSYFEERK